MVLAHAADAGGLPFSRGLLSYLLVATVCLCLWAGRMRTIALLSATHASRGTTGPDDSAATTAFTTATVTTTTTTGEATPVTAAGDGALPAPLVGGRLLVATRVVGLVGLVALVVVAWFGAEDGGLNPATLFVTSVAYLALPPLCLVIGDLWTPFDPFVTVAALAGSVRRRRNGESEHGSIRLPSWLPAAGLFAFLLVTNAGPDNFPPPAVASGNATAAVLVGLVLWAAALGALVGTDEARRALPFSRLAAILGGGGILGRRPDGRLAARRPLGGILDPFAGGPGTGGLVAVWLGGVLYAALTLTNWWARVDNNRSTASRQVIAVVGLVWAVALVAGVHQSAMWLVARLGNGRAPSAAVPTAAQLTDRFGAAIVPLGVAWVVAHFLAGWLVDLQFVRVLASDPLAGGHNFFGTIADPVNYAPLSPSNLGWIESAVLLVGAAGAAVTAHRVAVGLLAPRHALAAALPVAIELGAAVTAAMYILVG